MKHSRLFWIAFGQLLFTAFTLSGVAQSLGEVAAAEKVRQKTTHKVYENDDLTVARKGQTATDSVSANCDESCEAQLQSELKSAMRTPISRPEWESMFADGLSAMKDDREWQDLYSRVRDQVCAEKRNKADAADPQPLIKELLAKVMNERHEVEDLTVRALSEPRNTPDAQSSLRTLRTKAVKLGIMGVQLKNLPSGSCAEVKPARAAGTNH